MWNYRSTITLVPLLEVATRCLPPCPPQGTHPPRPTRSDSKSSYRISFKTIRNFQPSSSSPLKSNWKRLEKKVNSHHHEGSSLRTQLGVQALDVRPASVKALDQLSIDFEKQSLVFLSFDHPGMGHGFLTLRQDIRDRNGDLIVHCKANGIHGSDKSQIPVSLFLIDRKIRKLTVSLGRSNRRRPFSYVAYKSCFDSTKPRYLYFRPGDKEGLYKDAVFLVPRPLHSPEERSPELRGLMAQWKLEVFPL